MDATSEGFGTGARGRIVTFPADPEERNASAVVVTPTPPPTTTPPTTAPPVAIPPAPSLPATGASSSSVESAKADVVFLVVGLTLVFASRRRPAARRALIEAAPTLPLVVDPAGQTRRVGHGKKATLGSNPARVFRHEPLLLGGVDDQMRPGKSPQLETRSAW